MTRIYVYTTFDLTISANTMTPRNENNMRALTIVLIIVLVVVYFYAFYLTF